MGNFCCFCGARLVFLVCQKKKKKKKPSLLFNKSSASCFFRDHEWSLKLKATDSKTHTTQTQVDLFLYANFFSLKTVGN